MRVLVAVDGAVLGKMVADFIGNHIWPPKTAFRIVHVIEPESKPEKLKKAESFLSKVEELIKQRKEDSKIERKVVAGTPREAILTVASRWRADFIILGSGERNRKSLKAVLGSTSTALAFQSDCSVLILKMPKRGRTVSLIDKTGSERRRRAAG